MSKFACKVEGDARTADAEAVRRALDILIGDGQTFEIRGLWRGPDFARSRVCRTIDEGVSAALEMSDASGIYFTLNPCREGLDKAASNGDIADRRWVLIDCDPVKPADVSATDAERNAAVDLACEVAEHLSGAGWPEAVWIESGNGAHLLYATDLPNDKLSQQLIRDALVALAERFDSDRAKVDRAVHNAARISKLPGTWVRKGEDTPDRPHRMARLVKAPEDSGEIVTGEMLRSLARPKAEAPGAKASAWTAVATDGDGLKRYVRSAVERECTRVCMAPEGTRDNTLNTAIFNLGTMDAWPEMNAADAKISLHQVGIRCGLPDSVVKEKLDRVWRDGAAAGRPRPIEQAMRTAAPASTFTKAPEPEGPLTIRGDKVNPKKVRWLWPDRIAIGFISLFVGRTGIGKSFVLCDFAARITRGDLIPNSVIHVSRGNVLIISEDPHDYVLAPRLIELGADMARISFLTWEAMAAYSLDDIGMLNRAYHEAGEPSLIVIDPPSNFMAGRDEHKNSDVRQTLMKIVSWLTSKEVACVMVTHEKKPSDKGVEALYRIMSSVAWSSTARIACGFYPDPDDESRCLFAGIKSNLGSKAGTLAYRVVKTDALATVEWLGESETSADTAACHTARAAKPTQGMNAVTWLEERFRERREWPSEELKGLARADGLSKNTLWSDEVKALPIQKRKRVSPETGEAAYHWIADFGWPPEEISGKQESRNPEP